MGDSTLPGRCGCAHLVDPSPCDGPAASVQVVDEGGGAATECVHHGAVLLASLQTGRVYPGPSGVDGAAIDASRRAGELPPFAFWSGGEPR